MSKKKSTLGDVIFLAGFVLLGLYLYSLAGQK